HTLRKDAVRAALRGRDVSDLGHINRLAVARGAGPDAVRQGTQHVRRQLIDLSGWNAEEAMCALSPAAAAGTHALRMDAVRVGAMGSDRALVDHGCRAAVATLAAASAEAEVEGRVMAERFFRLELRLDVDRHRARTASLSAAAADAFGKDAVGADAV